MSRIERGAAVVAENVEEALLQLAVLLSTAAHRDHRREQWAADLRDADELGMARSALVAGALSTAILHRRSPRQTITENLMTTTAPAMRTAPHTIPTVPLLVVTALLSMLASSFALVLLGSFVGTPARQVAAGGIVALASLAPAVCVAAGALLSRAPRRARRRGAVALLALGVTWALILQGPLRIDHWLGAGLVASAATLVWLLVQGVRGPRLGAAAVPLALSTLILLLLSSVVISGIWSTMGLSFILVNLLPFIAATLAGAVATRARAARALRPAE